MPLISRSDTIDTWQSRDTAPPLEMAPLRDPSPQHQASQSRCDFKTDCFTEFAFQLFSHIIKKISQELGERSKEFGAWFQMTSSKVSF